MQRLAWACADPLAPAAPAGRPGRAGRPDRGSRPGPGASSLARSGYPELMARPRLANSARVTIGLKVSEADAARIDEVLTRPEFAGWSRPEWCREIIRSALRYYVGEDSAPDPGQARIPVPAAPQPASPTQSQSPAPSAARPPAPAAGTSSPAVPPGTSEPVPAAPEPPAQRECPHPSDAWDYETGTCAACGAGGWD
jgi:hypothetical protein